MYLVIWTHDNKACVVADNDLHDRISETICCIYAQIIRLIDSIFGTILRIVIGWENGGEIFLRWREWQAIYCGCCQFGGGRNSRRCWLVGCCNDGFCSCRYVRGCLGRWLSCLRLGAARLSGGAWGMGWCGREC